MNLLAAFDSAARKDTEKTFIRFEGRSISYGEMKDRSHIAAGVLAANGVVAGDAVALMCLNTPAFVEGASGIMAPSSDRSAGEPQASGPRARIHTSTFRLEGARVRCVARGRGFCGGCSDQDPHHKRNDIHREFRRIDARGRRVKETSRTTMPSPKSSTLRELQGSRRVAC
jgi:AMP-binding enzyme